MIGAIKDTPNQLFQFGKVALTNPVAQGVVFGAMDVGPGAKWVLGAGRSAAKWARQFEKRGWTAEAVTEALEKGERFAAENLVNKGNSATRYVHPETGRSVVIDDKTREVIHVGGDGSKYDK